jgi:hypothetical protein
MGGSTVSAQTIAEAKCRAIYGEAKIFFKPFRISYLENYYGFAIMQGPPLFRARILFIGYQPGGASDDGRRERDRGSEMKWPCTCNNATGNWPLSKKLQRMFKRPYLKKCVGMNAIFLRSPNTRDYERHFDKTVRAQIEEFCLPRVNEIIEAIDPLKIAVFGFQTQELFGVRWEVDLTNEAGKVLTRVGQIAGYRAIAFPHPTGARGFSNADFDAISDRVLAW